MSTQHTDFAGLAGNNAQSTTAYSFTRGPTKAAEAGAYQENRDGIKKMRLILGGYVPKTPKRLGL